MDDLELIRDLGRELEHEPPPTLARQRTRLLDGARRRRRVIGRWTLLGVVAAVTAAAVLVPALVVHGRDARPVAPGTTAPAPAPGRAMNVLLLGSDERGDGYSARSDTMMLLHVPADRKDVRAVSIPRDSLVVLPACKTPEGKVIPSRRGLINSAFPLGGVSCAVKTVESLTGVRIDQTVVVGFTGFVRMVEALGGVRMTVPRPGVDPKSGLRLRPGSSGWTGRRRSSTSAAGSGTGTAPTWRASSGSRRSWRRSPGRSGSCGTIRCGSASSSRCSRPRSRRCRGWAPGTW
ncbi:LCP family protein [Actinomadura madurae]|nr:LCP family protein [Actinomadura madurae]URN06625.1 LCP family protein [Actinomadura madurae]